MVHDRPLTGWGSGLPQISRRSRAKVTLPVVRFRRDDVEERPKGRLTGRHCPNEVHCDAVEFAARPYLSIVPSRVSP
jgi:hypothetical protein